MKLVRILVKTVAEDNGYRVINGMPKLVVELDCAFQMLMDSWLLKSQTDQW